MTFFWNNPTEHYPFKRKKKLGPGPMGETNRQAEKWDCETERPYVYVCTGIADDNAGEQRVIRVDPDRKEEYNRLYRDWQKEQASKKRRRRRNPERIQLSWQPVRNVHGPIYGEPEYLWQLMRKAPEYRGPSPMQLEIHTVGEYPFALAFVDSSKGAGEPGRRRMISRHKTLDAAQTAGFEYAKRHKLLDARQRAGR